MPSATLLASHSNWLKQHGAGERSFTRALRQFLSEQAERISNTIRENFPGGPPSPYQTPLIFRADDEHELLRPIIRRNLSSLLIIGARAEARAVLRRLDAKAVDDEFLDVDLPPTTVAALRNALRELEEQPYWRAIQAATEKNLAKIIGDGLEEKLSSYAIGKRIREELGGLPANKRAQKIARTETTGAMNAGHMAYMDSLIEEGIVTGKEWNAIGDSDCRERRFAEPPDRLVSGIDRAARKRV